jgi:hypothetical protein
MKRSEDFTFIFRKLPFFRLPLKQERPDINIRDIYSWVAGFGRHCVRLIARINMAIQMSTSGTQEIYKEQMCTVIQPSTKPVMTLVVLLMVLEGLAAVFRGVNWWATPSWVSYAIGMIKSERNASCFPTFCLSR